MKQATLKAAGTAALGVAIAAVAAGSASAATGGLGGLPNTGGLTDTGKLTSTLGQSTAATGPVTQTTGLLNPGTAQAAMPAADAPASATRGLPPVAGALSGPLQQAPGVLAAAKPVGGLPGLG